MPFLKLRCTFGGQSIIPDVSVFAWPRIPRDEKGEIANVFLIVPDWSIEILSPNQSQTLVTKKLLHCLNHGAQLGWLIDPFEQTVFVYTPGKQTQVFDQPEQDLPVPDFAQALQLTIGSVFGWLLE